MFKPTPQLQRALRRLKLTTKQAGKDYYKGNRVGSMGRHTKHGGYIIDYKKVRTYVVPPLEDFKLTPFVSEVIDKPKGEYAGFKLGPMDGKLYLESWKERGVESEAARVAAREQEASDLVEDDHIHGQVQGKEPVQGQEQMQGQEQEQRKAL